mgnify:CR=1 FL=1
MDITLNFATISSGKTFELPESSSIMKFTPAPPQDVQDIVERIRIPSGAGEATH